MFLWPFKKPTQQSAEPARRRQVHESVTRSQVGQAKSAERTESRQPERIETDFRRNRTLSSYRHDTPQDSSRHQVHHLAIQRRKVGSLLLLTIGLVVLLALLLWQLIVQVQVVTSSKQLSRAFDGTVYEHSINDYLLANPAQRLRFALNPSELSAYVSNQLPEVESLQIRGGLGALSRADFAITFRTPVAGWQINGKQYFVDASGVVFQTNYYDQPSVQIVDESGITPEQGTAVASTRLLGFLGKAVSQAQGRGYTVVKAVLPATTTRTVDLYFADMSTRARCTIDRGVGEQIEDFDRSYSYLKANNLGADYIDVRVSGRAVYK